MIDKPQKLTLKQTRFCEEYLATGNATEAYRRAYNVGGMKDNTIKRNACTLIGNPKILSAISDLSAMSTNARVAALEQRREFWTLAMNGRSTDADGKPVEVKMADRLKASELLGKSFGDFLDRAEHSGQMTVRVVRDEVTA